MRKSRFTEAQIVAIVREYDTGVAVGKLARKHGVHANTIRLWKTKYNGMDTADLVRLKELEAQNAQMHRIIAKLTLKVDAPLVKRLTELAQEHPRYACKRLYVIYERIAGKSDPYMTTSDSDAFIGWQICKLRAGDVAVERSTCAVHHCGALSVRTTA